LKDQQKLSGFHISCLRNEIDSLNFNQNNFNGENENTEVLSRLQIVYPETDISEIEQLLKENKNDFISVMNILKDKNLELKKLAKKEQVKKNVAETREKLRQKFLLRKQKHEIDKNSKIDQTPYLILSNRNKKSDDENSQIQTEGLENPKSSRIVPQKKNWDLILENILGCNSPDQVKTIIMRLSNEYEKESHAITRYKAENYILKKGILQRKDITTNEIRKRMQLEERVKQLEHENYALRNIQSSNENCWKNNWQNDHFGKQSDF
jgi:hypothetical protein